MWIPSEELKGAEHNEVDYLVALSPPGFMKITCTHCGKVIVHFPSGYGIEAAMEADMAQLMHLRRQHGHQGKGFSQRFEGIP